MTALELWADMRAGTVPWPEGTTAVLHKHVPGGLLHKFPPDMRGLELDADTGRLLDGGNRRPLGAAFHCATPQDVDKAMAAVGSVDWVLLFLSDWTMIPLENLIAAANGGPTGIAVQIQDPSQVQGAAFALQLGVDALLLDPRDEALWAAAREAKARRDAAAAQAGASGKGKAKAGAEEEEESPGRVALVEATVESVEAGGVGDRVCLDLIQLLKPGEGCLVGSSALGLALVQAEVLSSNYVPPRPFRVNAGPVHSYVLMEDGRAEYLSGVRAGDKVRVVDQHGSARGVAVGRCKIESRPHMKVAYAWTGADGATRRAAQAFLQQAETVRFISPPSGPDSAPQSVAITDLQPGDRILIRAKEKGTHIGREINAQVVEK